MKLVSVFLLASTLLTGFMGGIGFVNCIGFIPALKYTPAVDMVRYWQIVDSYMSVRMPIFGAVILLCFIAAGFLLIRQSYKHPLWLLLLALAFILSDIAMAIMYNFPFNRLIQSITTATIPGDFEYYRSKSVLGFSLRSVCMIGSFASTIAALFLQASKGLLR